LFLAVGLGVALGAGFAVVTSLGASTLYSIGPRLKRWPFLGTALNAVIFTPLLLLARTHDPAPRPFTLQVVVFVALLLQNQLLHEQADSEEDAASAHTTGRAVGARATRLLVLLLGITGVAIATSVAPSPILGMVTLGIVSLCSFIGVRGRSNDPANDPVAFGRRRRAHRIAAFVGGALLYIIGWLA
jgi:hypothetical protein